MPTDIRTVRWHVDAIPVHAIAAAGDLVVGADGRHHHYYVARRTAVAITPIAGPVSATEALELAVRELRSVREAGRSR